MWLCVRDTKPPVLLKDTKKKYSVKLIEKEDVSHDVRRSASMTKIRVARHARGGEARRRKSSLFGGMRCVRVLSAVLSVCFCLPDARFRFETPSAAHALGLPIGKHLSVSATIDGKPVVRFPN